MARWVQSIYSVEATKWALRPCIHNDHPTHADWVVEDASADLKFRYLPRSEYHEVPAPTVWTDVTQYCEFTENGEVHYYPEGAARTGMVVLPEAGFRLRKVKRCIPPLGPARWAFLVEREEPNKEE